MEKNPKHQKPPQNQESLGTFTNLCNYDTQSLAKATLTSVCNKLRWCLSCTLQRSHATDCLLLHAILQLAYLPIYLWFACFLAFWLCIKAGCFIFTILPVKGQLMQQDNKGGLVNTDVTKVPYSFSWKKTLWRKTVDQHTPGKRLEKDSDVRHFRFPSLNTRFPLTAHCLF